MPGDGCQDHAMFIEDCMGCNGGRWDPEAADLLIEAGYAVGITAAAIRVAKAEIERLQANQAAQVTNADRVREIVASMAATEVPVPIAVDIANRIVALLGPTLQADEREQLASLRREAIADDYPVACAWIDQLLGAIRSAT